MENLGGYRCDLIDLDKESPDYPVLKSIDEAAANIESHLFTNAKNETYLVIKTNEEFAVYSPEVLGYVFKHYKNICKDLERRKDYKEKMKKLSA